MNIMWQTNLPEADALRSQHGSSESRREMRRKLRIRSRVNGLRFVVTSSNGSVSALAPPPDPISDEGITDRLMSQTSTTSVSDVGDKLETNTQLLQWSNAIPDQLPGLLRLPLELRQQIYGYLFPHNDQHMLQTKRQDMPIPNFVIKHSKDSEYSRYRRHNFERVGANTAIMRLNKQLHFETRDYLFRNCIIKIDVNEDGYSFLEDRSGEHHVSFTSDSGRFGRARDVASSNPSPRDRDAEWHQRFLSNFDFTLPKRLIISIEAASHENPKEIVQTRKSMTSLCNILRRCSEIRCIEVIPQSQTYRLSEDENGFNFGSNFGSSRGSYFAWEHGSRLLPSSQPRWHHKLSRVKRFSLRFDRKAVWGGRLSYLVFEKVPDVALVLLPLAILRNVSEMSVQLPRTTASLGIISAEIDSICNRAKEKTSLPVAEDIAENHQLTEECRERLKAVEMRKRIKKAERTKAKDRWYAWHCETCGEEFTEHGEQGYESSDDADW